VLGFAMARTLAAPIAPDYRLDWEDAELTMWMATAVEEGDSPLADIDLPNHIAARLAHARMYGFGSSIGFKSPLLGIGGAAETLRMALAAEGFSVVTVDVHRIEANVKKSIARQPGADVLRRWNELIRWTARPVGDYGIVYEEFVADPALQVEQLARRLGVVDPVRIAQATARVLRPCS